MFEIERLMGISPPQIAVTHKDSLSQQISLLAATSSKVVLAPSVAKTEGAPYAPSPGDVLGILDPTSVRGHIAYEFWLMRDDNPVRPGHVLKLLPAYLRFKSSSFYTTLQGMVKQGYLKKLTEHEGQRPFTVFQWGDKFAYPFQTVIEPHALRELTPTKDEARKLHGAQAAAPAEHTKGSLESSVLDLLADDPQSVRDLQNSLYLPLRDVAVVVHKLAANGLIVKAEGVYKVV